MTEQVKRRSLAVLAALRLSVEEAESLSNEVVQMIIRGDDNRRIPPTVSEDIEAIRDAVDTIKVRVENLDIYVNRKQQTHRL